VNLPVGSLAVQALAVAYLVGRDGSPGWRVARVLLVVTLTGAALLALTRGGRPYRAVASLGAALAGLSAGRAGPRRAATGSVCPPGTWRAATEPPWCSATAPAPTGHPGR
jgi:hypothetical protein